MPPEVCLSLHAQAFHHYSSTSCAVALLLCELRLAPNALIGGELINRGQIRDLEAAGSWVAAEERQGSGMFSWGVGTVIPSAGNYSFPCGRVSGWRWCSGHGMESWNPGLGWKEP